MFSSNTSQVSNDATYIEDVFSTYLYTGNGSTQTITNGIDLSTYGGLVWTKVRSTTYSHFLADTIRGAGSVLSTNNTNAADTGGNLYSGFNTNGYGVTTSYGSGTNGNGATFASWTFRKQPKFFDVQTATTNGSSSYGSTVPSMTITHSLGSVPGCVMVKRTDGTGDWYVWHRSLPALSGLAQTATYARLNTTDAAAIFGGNVNGTGGWIQVTATNIYLDAWFNTYEPGSFVIYIFAHDAGGFGLTGADNVISCGSFTSDSTGFVTPINLGYEPQFVLIKRTDSTGGWYMFDNMRGVYSSYNTPCPALSPNTSAAESNGYWIGISATGFDPSYISSSSTYIYIAIRRGPMKTPTSGTSVFSPNTQTGAGTSAGQTITTNFPVDLEISSGRADNSGGNYVIDRLRGGQNYMRSNTTGAEVNFTSWTPLIGFANNTGITDANYGSTSLSYVAWNFRRAPGFFDEVCDSTGGPTIYHNLGVAPELIIAKVRNYSPQDWFVDVPALGSTRTLNLNTTGAASSTNYISSPTASQFTTTLGGGGYNYVYYLFASCPGVSKVGSYSGTGATQTISCGFAARFVLIKRTDSTGDWFVWDTARGMVAGTDPRLALNSTAAEANNNWVYTDASGFQIVTTDATVNASGGSYIYLAIA